MDLNIIVMSLMDTQYLKLNVCFANRADPDLIAGQLDPTRTIHLNLGSGKYNRAIGVPWTISVYLREKEERNAPAAKVVTDQNRKSRSSGQYLVWLFPPNTRAQMSETYSCAGLLNCRNDLQSDPSAVDLQKFLSAKKNLFWKRP